MADGATRLDDRRTHDSPKNTSKKAPATCRVKGQSSPLEGAEAMNGALAILRTLLGPRSLRDSPTTGVLFFLALDSSVCICGRVDPGGVKF